MAGAGAGTGKGRRRLVAAIATGIALLAALVALQLVDEGGDRPSAADAPVQVKGVQVDRASLTGTIAGAAGWRVEVTISVGGATQTVVASPDGRYRARDLVASLGELTWAAESATSSASGIRTGGGLTGRTQVVLAPGANTFDFAL